MSNTSTFISKGVVSNLTTLSLSPTLSSFYGGGASSYTVDVGSFNYDAYGYSIAFRKDNGPIDAYINSIIALGNIQLIWTFTPASGTPFNRLLYPIASNTEPLGANIWTISTADGNALQGGSTGYLDFNTFPNGTIFTISTKSTSFVDAALTKGVTTTWQYSGNFAVVVVTVATHSAREEVALRRIRLT